MFVICLIFENIIPIIFFVCLYKSCGQATSNTLTTNWRSLCYITAAQMVWPFCKWYQASQKIATGTVTIWNFVKSQNVDDTVHCIRYDSRTEQLSWNVFLFEVTRHYASNGPSPPVNPVNFVSNMRCLILPVVQPSIVWSSSSRTLCCISSGSELVLICILIGAGRGVTSRRGSYSEVSKVSRKTNP